MKKSVLIFSGHTGGHLFPAISFAQTLKSRFPEVTLFLVTSAKGQTFISPEVSNLFGKIFFLRPFPFPSGFSWNLLMFPLRFAAAFYASQKILSEVHPDLCVGFGSYVSYPGMRLAVLNKIPTLIHEQNKIPGKATLWLHKQVDEVAYSFENTFPNLNNSPKYAHVGLPLRPAIRNSNKTYSRKNSSEPFRLLIMGGSQGSRRINQWVFDVFSKMSPEEKKRLVVKHIAGEQGLEAVIESYRKQGIRAEVFSFQHHMYSLFQDSDFAIARAGANTLFELAHYGIPALVIPYPYAGAHQTDNARVFEKHNAIWFMEEENLDEDRFYGMLCDMIEQPDLLKAMSIEMKKLEIPYADEKLVTLAAKLMGIKSCD